MVATLLVDVKHPGSQEDLVRNWEPACSLVEDAISRAEFAPRSEERRVGKETPKWGLFLLF